MSFRKRKRIIEEETENEDENIENDFDDAPDISEIFEPEISWENFRENMKFELPKSEIPADQRNKILGGIRPLPSSKNIDAQSFENPFKLWMDTYGDFFFPEVLEATNKKAEKLKSNQVSFKRYFPLCLSDIFEYFAHLLVLGVEKHPDNCDLRKFMSRWGKCPEFLELDGFECMARAKFEFIHTNLDIGSDIKVKKDGQPQFEILDLAKKFGPIISHFNSVSPELKTPDRNFPLVLDEQLRGSYSKSNSLKQFMKGKPCKFGDKFFLLTDSDRFCHQMLLQMPAQFKSFDGLDDLVSKIIPSKFQNLGFTVVGDNYFFTLNQIVKLLNQNTAVICTMRKNRVERYLTKEQFLEMTQKPRKKDDFQRKIVIFDTSITKTKVLQLQSYFDRQSNQPCFSAISDPHLVQSHSNDPDNKNVTKNLSQTERPPCPEFYNLEMGYTDEFDREC